MMGAESLGRFREKKLTGAGLLVEVLILPQRSACVRIEDSHPLSPSAMGRNRMKHDSAVICIKPKPQEAARYVSATLLVNHRADHYSEHE